MLYSGRKVLSSEKTRMNFAGTGRLNRFDYGLLWNEVIESGQSIVGATVEIILKVALIKEE